MNKKKLIISILIPLIIGGLSSLLIKDHLYIYPTLNLPPLAPSSSLFPIIWIVLYILMGISCYYVVISNSKLTEKALLLYGFQLIVNFFWPLFFFNLNNYFLALIILIILLLTIIFMLVVFKQINKLSFYLNLPYLFWIIFALYLNFMIFLNN